MMPLPDIPAQTRRTTYRRLNQMNGDFLTLLKKPICSELGPDVKGHNHAHRVDLRRQLNVFLKEKDMQLTKVKRSQDAVYSIMLRAHKLRKICQKKEYLQTQERLRQEAEEHRKSIMAEPKTDDSKNAESDLNAPNMENLPQDQSIDKSITRKAKVLQVQKDSPRVPLVAERECTIVAEEDQINEKEDNVVSLRKFSKLNGNIIHENNHTNGAKTGQMDENKNMKKCAPLPGIAKEVHWEEQVKEEARDMNKYKVLPPVKSHTDFPSQPKSLGLPTPGRQSICSASLSQVQLNKLEALRRDQLRKEILDKEPVTLFMRNSHGEVVPSLLPFRRKAFEVPSMREMHFQRKMLRAQDDVRFNNTQKMERLFGKLEADGVQRQKWETRVREPEPPPEEAKTQTRGEVTVSLADMMRAFGRSSNIPENIDPKSFEALQFCRYIRSYSPPNRNHAES